MASFGDSDYQVRNTPNGYKRKNELYKEAQMKTAVIILSILLGYFILMTFSLLTVIYTFARIVYNDYKDEKHFCNYCNKTYIYDKEERAKTVCDRCKRPLTLHKNHPNYNIQEEEIDLPFEEYSNENE